MRSTTIFCVFASVMLAVNAAPIDVAENDFAQASSTSKQDSIFDSNTNTSDNKRAEDGTPGWKRACTPVIRSLSVSPHVSCFIQSLTLDSPFVSEDQRAEASTPSWKRNDAALAAEAGAPGWKRGDQGAPGWKRADQGAPGWKRGDQGAPGWKRGNQGAPGWKRGDQGAPGWKRGDQGAPGW